MSRRDFTGKLTKLWPILVDHYIDEERSDIEISPRSGELIVHELFISEEKLKQIPLSNRVAFRVKGAETAMFFCEELFDVIDFMAEFDSLRKAKISTDDLAPKF